VLGQPRVGDRVNSSPQRKVFGVCRGAGVERERPGSSEQQEHERRLEVDRHVLAQDVGVLVVDMHLDIWIGVVLGGL
jgi:hypothetical protein